MVHMLSEDTERSKEFSKLLNKNGFLNDEMSIALIDLTEPKPRIFGYAMDHYIYPASVYKIFIGAEVLRKVETGELAMDQLIEIKSPNDVDTDPNIFPGDTRNLLKTGDNITINYLLDLMLTRSYNTASNTLIDLVGRENITNNIIYKYNWYGSEVTRKFLNRVKEGKPYQFSSTTLSCARHLAEFFYRVETETLISPFVSQKLKEYMLKWMRGGREGLSIDAHISFYRKGGWLETNLWKHSLLSAIRSILNKRWAVIRWSNDAGVITEDNSKYVVALLTVHKSISPNSYFDLKKLAKLIHKFMEK